MKKRYFMLLPFMALSLCLIACNNQDKPTDNPGDGPQPVDPENPNPPVTDIYYSAKVLYPNGDPVTNTKVQWCTGNSCKSPVAVDNSGVAKYKLDDVDGGYYLHIAEGTMPAGYTYNPNIYTADEKNRDIEIKLLKLETASSGDGKKETPYQLGVGAFNITVESKGVYPYFVFTAPEAGTYEIESLAMDKLATVIVDPIYLPYDDASFSNRGTPVSTGGTGKNFKSSIIVEKDGVVAFGISFNSSKDLVGKDVAGQFDIVISKK